MDKDMKGVIMTAAQRCRAIEEILNTPITESEALAKIIEVMQDE